MNLVTYVNIRLKCYINLFTCFYIVPAEKDCPQMLARAINFFWNDFGKKIRNYNSNFLTITESGLSSSKIHMRLSPLFNPSFSTISLGIVVLNESDLEVL